MTVIVYGGAGYIGSHLIKALLSFDKKVICIDNLNNSYSSVFEGYPNLENLQLITEDEYQYTETDQVEAIFHLAASTNIEESFRKPLECYENNVGITCRALEMCRATNCSTFIFASSSDVYGRNGTFTETDLRTPISPYGRSKAACEDIIEDEARLHPTKRFFSLRYFDVYGGVENPKQITSLVSSLFHSIKLGIDYTLHGMDYKTEDGTYSRDYIHINDLIQGHIQCLRYNKPGYHVFNFGSGQSITVKQVLEVLACPTLKVQPKARQPWNLDLVVASIDKARNELGWTPSHTFNVKNMSS